MKGKNPENGSQETGGHKMPQFRGETYRSGGTACPGGLESYDGQGGARLELLVGGHEAGPLNKCGRRNNRVGQLQALLLPHRHDRIYQHAVIGGQPHNLDPLRQSSKRAAVGLAQVRESQKLDLADDRDPDPFCGFEPRQQLRLTTQEGDNGVGIEQVPLTIHRASGVARRPHPRPTAIGQPDPRNRSGHRCR